MKKRNFILLLIFFMIILVFVDCVRDPERIIRYTPLPPAFSQSGSLWCSANVDITVELPINFAILQGSGFGGVGNIVNYKWQKINGPSSYSFDNSDTPRTKVMNLEKGIYQFELTAIDNAGSSVRDTMTLHVEDPTSSRHQVFFWDMRWVCPFGCGMAIESISSFVPPGSLFSVYIKRDFSSGWELIVPYSTSAVSRYYYEQSSAGGIFIWEEPDVTIYDHPEVKIVF